MSGQMLLEQGAILEGPFWPERIKVTSTKKIGTGIEVSGKGLRSERFYSRILMQNDLIKIRKVALGRKSGRKRPMIKLCSSKRSRGKSSNRRELICR